MNNDIVALDDMYATCISALNRARKSSGGNNPMYRNIVIAEMYVEISSLMARANMKLEDPTPEDVLKQKKKLNSLIFIFKSYVQGVEATTQSPTALCNVGHRGKLLN